MSYYEGKELVRQRRIETLVLSVELRGRLIVRRLRGLFAAKRRKFYQRFYLVHPAPEAIRPCLQHITQRPQRLIARDIGQQKTPRDLLDDLRAAELR